MSPLALPPGQRILVVDDDIDTLFLLAFTLEECGAKVAAAPSVSEAIELFKELHPTLLISDIGLPFEDGFSLIRELRILEAELGWRVPAIALTGYASKEARERALELGFQQYLTKPLLPDALIEVIVQVLGQSDR
ncbi:response regulator [Trichocoleus sp. FACHB-591]|uniref:response regulator n=1 Tax=Trichocoleus sp. FACHB-591 TaxID=2692872 RepID=UPI00168886F1|nr:response regulator [Trichocoleus sp. FACHB-591]MBD2098466.1 response regulator [Trichocoleus sp. FACHB-591]